ncbi:MAG: conjugative transposon protein TraN [Flammeovirgaceae bacterium]|nr:conjugative transposon protein TraN [Flammeovirgaceae bacterium]
MIRYLICVWVIFFSTISTQAQQKDTIPIIHISANMGTYLSFEDSITLQDCLLAKPVEILDETTQEIVQTTFLVIKSISANTLAIYASFNDPKYYPLTNMLVETTTGRYIFKIEFVEGDHDFYYEIDRESAINYQVNPVPISPVLPASTGLVKQEVGKNQTYLEEQCEKVIREEVSFEANGLKKQKMTFALFGIFSDGDYNYFKFYVENHSNIPFKIREVFFTISSKGNGTQNEINQEILCKQFVEMNTGEFLQEQTSVEVGKKRPIIFVCATPKFTLSTKQRLKIRLMEEDGNRDMELKVESNYLLKALGI